METHRIKTIKKRVFKVCIPICRMCFSIFYDKKYLKGKYFDDSAEGWIWAWKGLFWQKVLGYNRQIPWPMSPFSRISSKDNIVFDVNDYIYFQTFGSYFQNISAKIIIGKGTWIAPNVSIITSNHDPNDLNQHRPGKDVIIGTNCWIGINSVILPGVHLGDYTIVGAGSVVTKSFPEGNCIIAGNPAKLIKRLEL